MAAEELASHCSRDTVMGAELDRREEAAAMHGSNTEETTFHRVAAVAAFEVCRMQDVFLLGLFRPSHVTENCKSVCFTAGRDQAYRLSKCSMGRL